MMTHTFGQALRIAGATLLFAAGSQAADDFAITGVNASADRFDPAARESVRVRFALSQSATVEVMWIDAANQIVRSHTLKNAAATMHEVTWDGKDLAGKAVPAEAYRYVIRAQADGNRSVTFDLGETSSDTLVPVHDITWLPADGVITYRVEKLSRVRLRVGFANGGPLLRTVSNWTVRAPGVHREKWDGRDASGFLDLGNDPRREITAVSYELPANSVIVGQPSDGVRVLTSSSLKVWSSGAIRKKQMFDYTALPAATLADYEAVIRINGKKLDPKAPLLTVRGKVPIEIDVPDADRAMLVSRRLEPVLFVNGEFAYENEIGFVPMTWVWDASSYQAGEHLISVNLRGYEGNFGIATVKVRVEP
jgi:hypothetical protein